MSQRLSLLVSVAVGLWMAACCSAAAPKPLKVFILAGQSNMEGQAVADLDGKDYNDGKGTLAFLMRDPSKTSLFKHLLCGTRAGTTAVNREPPCRNTSRIW